MAITRSAKKAHRQSLRRARFNLARKKKVVEAVKVFKKSPTPEGFQAVQKALDKAAKTNVLNKNTAARRKSRLSKLLKKTA